MRVRDFFQHTVQLWGLALLVLVAPGSASAQWQLGVGAENPDMGTQAMAFLPNEIWVHAGDNVTWTSNSDEPHTLTFLKPGQVRPFFLVGCPGNSASGSPYDGSACVNSGFLFKGQAFNVTFPSPGNFKFACLLHEDMTGTVHVLSLAEALPHDQAFYDSSGASERRNLLTDTDGVNAKQPDLGNAVTVGIGEVNATGGGKQTLSILRFLHGTIVVHAGDTVEWTDDDPITPHTITFGPPAANPVAVSNNFTTDSDGALHATLNSPADTGNSGLVLAAPQERLGLPQAPLGIVRVRVTFTNPGTYNYLCSLHFPLGMVGKVVVVP
jgi:plastocyanin